MRSIRSERTYHILQDFTNDPETLIAAVLKFDQAWTTQLSLGGRAAADPANARHYQIGLVVDLLDLSLEHLENGHARGAVDISFLSPSSKSIKTVTWT